MPEQTGIAIVGCGFVADYYRYCLAFHPTLKLQGVWDRDPERLAAYVACWGDRAYRSLDELLADKASAIVLNLTTPESHAAITESAIAAGRHVYSEKPLGMTTAEAERMRDLARSAGVRLSAAPSNLLGESMQTAWAEIRRGAVGRVALAYAELDDGMVHRANYRSWLSRSGRPWPARAEFETGCTFEHAGYAITVFAAMFGPVRRVTAFSALLVPDKRTDPPLPHPAPDFSVGCLEFDGGVVARITNSIVAPYDHRMRIIGEEGSLEIREPWDFSSPVTRRGPSTSRLARVLERRLPALGGKRVPMARRSPYRPGRSGPTLDFMRGVAELADAIRTGRRCRLDEDFAVHVTEVTEMIQHPDRFGRPATVRSTFAPIEPMDWAR
ncbi:MAG TPA: Gfo/Idh/MocA family oxidoreductase [Hansschlegelia sp.]